jgi:hypothetical protein
MAPTRERTAPPIDQSQALAERPTPAIVNHRGRPQSLRIAILRPTGVGPQERAADYRVVAAWSAFLILIGAGAFVVGMAIHNEATAKPPAPRLEPIYYCATGEEIPLNQPCKERKDERNI